MTVLRYAHWLLPLVTPIILALLFRFVLWLAGATDVPGLNVLVAIMASVFGLGGGVGLVIIIEVNRLLAHKGGQDT